MNLEPYAPAVSLLLLTVLAIASFARAHGVLKRFGATTGPPKPAGSTPRQQAGRSPWWESHLQDYVAEGTPAPGAEPLEESDEECAPEPVVPEPATEIPAAPRQAHTPGPAIAAAQDVAAPERPCALEYVMAAPVELWFGSTRVGVRAGSDTERRFQRFADVLFEELSATRPDG